MLNIQQIYDLALEKAKKADIRGAKALQKKQKRLKEKYDSLSKEEKRKFDTVSLNNPYSDSRLLYTPDKNKKIKKILVGIDIDTAELLLAKELKVDMVLSHHPLGIALAGLDEVMHMQVEMLALEGIPINVAQNLMHLRISEVSRGVGVKNHYQTVDAAQLLKMPLMCSHTFCDNLVTKYISDLVNKNKNNLDTVGDIMKLLMTIPEYQIAQQRKFGPKIFVGKPENYLGKVIITEMTGGTNGSKDIYEHMRQAGIGTIIGMHMSEEWKKEAERNHINVIIAGHISSDSIGVNLLLDELEKKGIEIIPCSGLIRYSRNKK
ncbi:MAG: Nif3-like dinuclear metal center hexameric protein [Patescibacteria group bacterium]|jgi:putative NIF3 family GTP cyclohydrolase 1 type 2